MRRDIEHTKMKRGSMKIDLHLHTPASEINGDSINWNSELDSLKKLLSNKIGAFAFTDHNVFSSSTYLNTKKICGSKLIVFPGVEISVLKATGKIAHLLLIFNNESDENKIKDLEELCRLNLRKKGIRIDKVFEVFKEYEFVAIPHVGKGDHFKVNELDFLHHAIETTNLANLNYQKWKKVLNDKSVVAFSDTHVWRDFPQNDELETKIDFDGTFQDLKKQLLLNKNYTEVK